MKLSCCIIENESIYVHQLTDLLLQWASGEKCHLQIDSVSSEKEFAGHDPEEYDIIFIDIILDSTDSSGTGIDIARKIRSASYTGELVFLTNFQDFVFEGYPVHALDYLLKPASYDKISHCMNQVLEKTCSQNFVYRVKDTWIQIPYREIIYFSSSNHSTNVITVQKQYQIPRPIKDVLKILPSQFSQCHRTLIVNLQYIENMTNKEILLTNQERIPIGKSYLTPLRRDFIDLIKKRRIL